MTYFEKQRKADLYKQAIGILINYGAGCFAREIMNLSSLDKEEEEKRTKELANKMLSRALNGQLKRPYDKDEIEFIKETLGIEIEVPSKWRASFFS